MEKIFHKLEDRVFSMLYTPASSDARSSIGIVMMHSDGDYLEFPPALELVRRGYTVLTANVSDSRLPLDEKLRDVRAAVNALRSRAGIRSVVLFGHSGGATLMSAYQAAAENGASVFQDAKRILPMADVGPLPPADAVLLLDPNFGNGAMTLLSLDPAILDEQTGMLRDPSLDLFDPRNGYDPEKCCYTDDFIRRYIRAQGRRMNRLIDSARQRVALIEAGRGLYEDDEPLCIPAASQLGPNNKVFPQLTRFFSHTDAPFDHILADGSIVREVVPCVRPSRPNLDSARKLGFGALNTTVRTFLKSSAVRTLDDFGYDETTLHGVDWSSSFCCTTGNVRHISVPMLMMGMTGGYEYIAAEHAYRKAVCCADKTCAFVQGAMHYFSPLHPQYGDTVAHCFDYTDRWLAERLL